ncbi:MAG: proteasome assembly chaperone family protein [Candidatus Methanomethylophilus sp.]|nr:proteasome assembly chaperone family protein [Methanomethylophilus sp.]
MANIVRFDSRPVLKSPYFIEALPGIGNVGKIAGDFLADAFKAVKFVSIYSEDLPPQITTDEECVAHLVANELWYADIGGRDVVFLRGLSQGSTAEGQFALAQDVVSILLSLNVKRIITLGGYGTGKLVDRPRVLGAVSDAKLKPELTDYGVTFVPNEPQGGIIGAAGLLLGLGRVYGIDSCCLMGETSGYFNDYKSAQAVVGILVKMFAVDPDQKELQDRTAKFEELTAKVKETAADDGKYDSFSYIG